MSWRPAVWLLVAVCLVGMFLMVFERRQPAPARRLALDDAAVDLGTTPVATLRVAQGTSVVECVARRDCWYLVRPVATRASPGTVRNVLQALADTRVRERITPQQMAARGLDLARYGLDRPRLRVSVPVGNASRELLIGEEAPLGQLVFAQITGEPDVLAVTRNILDALPRRSDAWQARTVMPETILGANRIEIKQPGGFVQMVLKDGGWRLQQPRTFKADDRVVEALLEQLHQLQVESTGPAVTGIDLVAYGLGRDDAPLQVTVWTEGDDEGVTLMLGKPVQEAAGLVYGRVSDMAALCQLPQSAVAMLKVDAESLRDRRLFAGRPSDIVAMRLQDMERRVELSGNGRGWRIEDPVRGRADAGAVGQFLKGFCALETVAFPEPVSTNPVAVSGNGRQVVLSNRPFAPAGTNGAAEARTAGTWTFRFPSSGAGGTIEAYCEEERTIYRLRSADVDRLMARDEGGVRRSFTDPLAYLDRTVLDLQPPSVRRVTLSYRGREEAIVRDATGSWTVESPPDSRVLDEVVHEALQRVAPLRALRLETLNATNLTAYGLGDSATRITFGLSGDAGIQKTLILSTNMAANGVYGAVQGQDVVFVVPADVAARLTRSMVVWQ